MAKTRPKIAGVNFKEIISNSFEKISNQKGKVSITDIVKDTGYSKPTVYKYLTESQNNQLLSQPSPFKDKITKQVNQIIDDVFKNKKPLINASPNKIYEKIYGKKFNIKTDNIGVIKKILEKNPNWSKIRDAVTNTSARVGSGNKLFETVKFKDFDKVYKTAMKSRSLTRAGTVEEFILRDLKRHIDQGGTKFKFAKGNSLEKGFKGLKIKDLTKGNIIDFAAIKKDDPRFKEYKKVFNDIKKLKLTPYINPVTKEKITLLKGLQEATGIDAPLHIQHAKGVAVDPLKNLSIATHKANIGAKMVGSVEDVETLGVRSTVPGGKRVYGPVLNFEDEVNRLTKFSDRMIKGGGTRTLKTPTETLKGSVDNLVKKTVNTPGGCQAVVKRALGAKGGLFGETCEKIIRADPERAAVKLNNAITATKGPLKNLKDDSQKLIRLLQGEEFASRKEYGKYLDEVLGPPDDVFGSPLKDDMLKKFDKVQAKNVTPLETNIKYNNDIGAFESANGDIATQEDLKLYAEENPMEVKVGEEPPKVNKSVLKTVGKTLAKVGAPLPTALLDSYFIGQQVKDGKSTEEIAKDPLNWIGLAAMEPLSKVSGIAESGGLNKALRLGLNPATIRGITRFAGLPGLAISTAMTAYDQYKKYQNEEGFVYNLFNKEGN